MWPPKRSPYWPHHSKLLVVITTIALLANLIPLPPTFIYGRIDSPELSYENDRLTETPVLHGRLSFIQKAGPCYPYGVYVMFRLNVLASP